MRWEQIGYPPFRWMVGQRVHDGRHATGRVAWTDMQHLAHGLATAPGMKKWSANCVRVFGF